MRVTKSAILIILLILCFMHLPDTSAYVFKSGSDSKTLNINFAGPKDTTRAVRPYVERPDLGFDIFWQAYPGSTKERPKKVPIITPEPVGAALFVIGASALGLIRSRRNRNNKKQ